MQPARSALFLTASDTAACTAKKTMCVCVGGGGGGYTLVTDKYGSYGVGQ